MVEKLQKELIESIVEFTSNEARAFSVQNRFRLVQIISSSLDLLNLQLNHLAAGGLLLETREDQ